VSNRVEEIVDIFFEPVAIFVVVRGHRHDDLLFFLVIVEGTIAFVSIRIVGGGSCMDPDVLFEAVKSTIFELHRLILFAALALLSAVRFGISVAIQRNPQLHHPTDSSNIMQLCASDSKQSF
jgi:hypothetical protein